MPREEGRVVTDHAQEAVLHGLCSPHGENQLSAWMIIEEDKLGAVTFFIIFMEIV